MNKKLTPKEIIKFYKKLKSERGTWENHWQEVTDHILPRKNTVTTTRQPGEKRTWQLLDNTGVQSNELLAGALHGMLTNPDSPWFELTTGDIVADNDDEIRLWLQENTRKIHHVLNNSNFQTEVHELYIDLGAIGTACQFIEEDEKNIVRFSTKFIADYYIKEGRFGVVDTIFYESKWKAEDIIEEWGPGKHRDVDLSAKACDNRDFKVIHCVYPFEKRFYQVSMLLDQETVLAEGTFNEFPYVVPRWTKASGEHYGRSPGMNALPEMKVLNKMNETMLIGAQKKVDPPIQMPDDGYIFPPVTAPGGINYFRSGTNEFIKPVFNDTNLDFGYQAMEDRRKRVRDSFYIDQLRLQQGGPAMTATEVLQRTEESMRLLGPMLGRMQAEFLRPLIDRVFNIMMRKGLITPAPANLKNFKLDVRYSSLIAKSQRVSDAQNIMRTFQAAAPFINLDPSVADNFNGDACLRLIANVYGFPQLGLRGVKELTQIRQQKAQAQQMQMQEMQKQQELNNAAQMADISQKVGQNGNQA